MNYDIAIVGGGHAGLEAANISAQMGRKVLLISMEGVAIASAPCNPAIGGVGKGQVVREIDALGGLMGMLADRAGIQYRVLNESKGHAVRSTRVQIDKDKYSKFAEEYISILEGLDLIRGKVKNVLRGTTGFEISLSDGTKIKSSKLIITAGTFLSGVTHEGATKREGGRVNMPSSCGLNDLAPQIKFNPQRFKTGTPARLEGASLEFSKMIEQRSDNRALNFHCLNERRVRNLEQVSCYIAHTNKKTLETILENKEKSPLFNGQITGIGPRYCPSIEDKAFRYPDRHIHHVFVEPETLEKKLYYPNGLSTSLPAEVQQTFYNTILGLENAKIAIPGYAVEYDVIDTSRLDGTLQYIDLPGLYFAGQINGTSGYEEAAGQGIMAGINASLAFEKRTPLLLSRRNSYIGVMIEDLITSRRDEPYRLFTARAENRLEIREDNTILRMAEYRKTLKLKTELDDYIEKHCSQLIVLSNLCDRYIYKASEKEREYFTLQGYGPLKANIRLSELLKRSKLDPVKTLATELERFGAIFDELVLESVAVTKKYEGYITRSKGEAQRLQTLGAKKLDWESLILTEYVSFECRQRIKEIRPQNFGQLQLIEGIRPATLVYVANNLL